MFLPALAELPIAQFVAQNGLSCSVPPKCDDDADDAENHDPPMPALDILMDADRTEKWQSGGQLPSFYSPQSRPADRADDAVEQHVSLASSAQAADSPAEVRKDDSSAHSGPATQMRLPPLPSLLSPAFTPPSTPGTGTPTSSVYGAAPTSAPRGIPVDSSISSGGCGSKKPQLLETLPYVECVVRARIPTNITGKEMWLHVYTNNVDNKEHLAIVFGDHIRSKSLDAPRDGETEYDRMARGAYLGTLFPGRTTSGMMGREDSPASGHKTVDMPLVRVHSECYTGETVWSARCDCGEQLDEAARLMSLEGNAAGGVIIYLRQEGRGIGLSEKLKAYNLQDLGADTVQANLMLRHPADARSYGLATAMLMDLGLQDIRLLTNNPEKIRAVEGPRREVVVKERVPMIPLAWRGKGGVHGPEFDRYIKTKVRVLVIRCLLLLYRR